MKNQSAFMNNDRGFFLPYVLFITSLVFMITTTSIHLYQQDIQITQQYIEQLKIETLLQMGNTKFKEEYLPSELNTIMVDYSFPDGLVAMVYNWIDEDKYKLQFTIVTKNNSEYTILSTTELHD